MIYAECSTCLKRTDSFLSVNLDDENYEFLCKRCAAQEIKDLRYALKVEREKTSTLEIKLETTEGDLETLAANANKRIDTLQRENEFLKAALNAKQK